MDLTNWLFWNVDTQYDFVEPDGKLYVKDAELLKPAWKRLTQMAANNSVRVVNTCDYHFINSAEIDSNPDFVHSFPEHCIAESPGAQFIMETDPDEPVIFDWDKKYLITEEIEDRSKYRNFIIRKDAFDVFAGNPYTEIILKHLKSDVVVVYGVTTNVCVDFAVRGLAKRVSTVLVIEDAIKELTQIPLPFSRWKKLGIKLIKLNELESLTGQ